MNIESGYRKLKCIRFKFHIHEHKSVIDCKAGMAADIKTKSSTCMIQPKPINKKLFYLHTGIHVIRKKGPVDIVFFCNFVYSVTGAISHQIGVVLQLMMTTSHRTHHNHSLSMTSYNLISVQMIPQLNMLTFADIGTVTQRTLFVCRVIISDSKCIIVSQLRTS